jgi:hypothetical protein
MQRTILVEPVAGHNNRKHHINRCRKRRSSVVGRSVLEEIFLPDKESIGHLKRGLVAVFKRIGYIFLMETLLLQM